MLTGLLIGIAVGSVATYLVMAWWLLPLQDAVTATTEALKTMGKK